MRISFSQSKNVVKSTKATSAPIGGAVARLRRGAFNFLPCFLCIICVVVGGQNSRGEPEPDWKNLPTEELETYLDNSFYNESERMEMRFEIGLRHEKAGRYAEALAAYRGVRDYMQREKISQPEQLVEVHLREGFVLFKLKAYDDAIRTCRSLLADTAGRLTPARLATIYYIIGVCSLESGDTAEAERAFEKVVDLKDELSRAEEKQMLAEAHFNLGIFRKRDGVLDVAETHFGEVIALESQLQKGKPRELVRDAHLQLAEIAESEGDVQRYRHHLRAGATRFVEPDDLLAFARNAQAKGDYQFVEELIRGVSPGRYSSHLLVEVYLLLVDILMEQERFEEASQELERVLVWMEEAAFNEKPIAPEDKGLARIHDGNSLLNQALQLSPPHRREIYERAAEAYREAMQKIEHIYKKYPTWAADAHYGLATIAFEEENYSESAHHYRRAKLSYTDAKSLPGGEANAAAYKKKLALATFRWAKSVHELAIAHGKQDLYQYAVDAYQQGLDVIPLLPTDKERYALKTGILIAQASCYKALNQPEAVIETAGLLKQVAESALPIDTSTLVQAADLLFERNAYGEAAAAYSQALAEAEQGRADFSDANRVHLLTRLAYCYLEGEVSAQNLRAAIDTYQQLLEISQDRRVLDTARYNKALAHHQLGEFERAEHLFELVLASEPTWEMAKSLVPILTKQYKRQGRFDAAIRVYERALKVYERAEVRIEQTTITEVLWELGELHRSQGYHVSASSYYQRVVNSSADSEYTQMSYYFLAQFYEREYQWKDAESAYQMVVKQPPNRRVGADAAWHLVQLAQSRGEASLAIERSRFILENYPSEGDANIAQIRHNARANIVNALEAQTERTEAEEMLWIDQLRQLVSAERTSPEEKVSGYVKMGKWYDTRGEADNALDAYSQAKRVVTADGVPAIDGHARAALCYAEALIYHKRGAHSEMVLAHCQEALSNTPKPELLLQVQYLLGVNAIQRDDTTAAAEAFRAAVELAPPLGETAIAARSAANLGTLLREQASMDEATAMLEQAKQHAQAWKTAVPTEVDDAQAVLNAANHQLARIYEQSELHVDDAIEAWGQLRVGSTDETVKAEADYKLGVLYEKQANYDAARAHFESLVENFADSSDAEVSQMVSNAISRLPRICRELGDFDAATRYAESTASDTQTHGDPRRIAQTQYELAALYHEKAIQQSGDTDGLQKAAEAYTAALNAALTVESPDESLDRLTRLAAHQAGALLYKLQAYQRAIFPLKTFTEIAPDAPEIPTVLEQLAWCHYRLAEASKANKQKREHFAQAALMFTEFVESAPNDDRADSSLYRAGVARQKAGEMQSAIDAFERLIRNYPQSEWVDDALKTQGGLWYESKMYENALTAYQEFLTIFPNHEETAQVLYWVARCHHLLGESAQATEIYEQVKTQFPESGWAARAQSQIGHYHTDRGAYKTAIQEYAKLTRKNFPGIEADLRKRANRWIVEASDKGAEPIIQKARDAYEAAEQNTDAEAVKISADQAIRFGKQVLAEYPHSVYVDEGWIFIAEGYVLRDEPQKALDALRRLLKRYEGRKPPSAAKDFVSYAKQRITAIETELKFR